MKQSLYPPDSSFPAHPGDSKLWSNALSDNDIRNYLLTL